MHFLVGCDGLVKFPALQGAACRDNGEAIHPGLFIGFGDGENLFPRQKSVFVDPRVVALRLGAVLAVLAAAPAAPVDDGTQVHQVAAEPFLQFSCLIEQFFHVAMEEQVLPFVQIRPRNPVAVSDLFRQRGERPRFPSHVLASLCLGLASLHPCLGPQDVQVRRVTNHIIVVCYD